MNSRGIAKAAFAVTAVLMMLCVPLAACVTYSDGQSPTEAGTIEVKTSDELRQALCYPDVYKHITVTESFEANMKTQTGTGDYKAYSGCHVSSGVTLEIGPGVTMTLKDGTLYIDNGGRLILRGTDANTVGFLQVYNDSLVNRGTITVGTAGVITVGMVSFDQTIMDFVVVPGSVTNYGQINILAGGVFVLLDKIYNYGSMATEPAMKIGDNTLTPTFNMGVKVSFAHPVTGDPIVLYSPFSLYGDTGGTFTFNTVPTVNRESNPFTGDSSNKGTYSYKTENNWNKCTEWDGKSAMVSEHDNVVVGDVQVKEDFTVTQTLIVAGSLAIKEGAKLTVSTVRGGSMYSSGNVSINGELITDGTCNGMEYSVFDTGVLYANGEPYIGSKEYGKVHYMVDDYAVARAEFGVGYDEITGSDDTDVVRVTAGTVTLKRDVSYGDDTIIFVSGGTTLKVNANLEMKGALVNKGTVDLAYGKDLTIGGERSSVWGDVYCTEGALFKVAGDYTQEYGNLDNVRFEVRYGGSVTIPGDTNSVFYVGTYDSKDNDYESYVTLATDDAAVKFTGKMRTMTNGDREYDYTYEVTAGKAVVGAHSAAMEGSNFYVAPGATLEFTGAAYNNYGSIANYGHVKSSDYTLTNYGTYVGDTPNKFKNQMFQGEVSGDTVRITVSGGLDKNTMNLDVSTCPGVQSVLILEGGAKELKSSTADMEVRISSTVSMTMSADFISMTDRNGKDVFQNGKSWEIVCFQNPDTDDWNTGVFVYMKSGDDFVTDFRGEGLDLHFDVDDGSSLNIYAYYVDEDNVGSLLMETGPGSEGYTLWGQANFTVTHLSYFVVTSDPDFAGTASKETCTVTMPSGSGYKAYDLADGKVAKGGNTYFTLVDDGAKVLSVTSDKAKAAVAGTVCTVYDIEGNVSFDVTTDKPAEKFSTMTLMYIGLAVAALLLIAALAYLVIRKRRSSS